MQLAALRSEYELVAERTGESIQALKEVKTQAKGSDGASLVAVAQLMVGTTRLQESRIEEDMDSYMQFTYQVRDGEDSGAIADRAMALYLKDRHQGAVPP